MRALRRTTEDRGEHRGPPRGGDCVHPGASASGVGRAVLRSTSGARVRTMNLRAILRRAAGLAARFRGHSSTRAARRRNDCVLEAAARRSQGCMKVLFALHQTRRPFTFMERATRMQRDAGDPYLKPNTSFRNRLFRVVWGVAYVLLFRPSPRPFHRWRAAILRLFGAKIGPDCHIYPKARVWAPWNLQCDDAIAIADDAEVYNPSLVQLGSHAVVSQGAYLCGASHDYNDPAFPMIARPIVIGPYAWICARSTVQMGVTVGDGAVLALGGIATEDLAPWTVYGGIPARRIGTRSDVLKESLNKSWMMGAGSELRQRAA